ncbi:MAG TPA: hypothetical protein PLJ20_13605 [Candidatus Contendobacter sp.]|nr:hypothetical protein [Candidatus Contendobacter sp.]
MVSLISLRVRLMERPERVALLEPLLRQSGGATIGQLMAAVGERRDIISDDLEAMRDELGLPVRWDPESGTYRLEAKTAGGEPRPEGCDLALLYRAIALEEYLYVTFTTGSGETRRLHALPGKVRKVRGVRQVKLRERSGAWRMVELEAIREVAEAFGINK